RLRRRPSPDPVRGGRRPRRGHLRSERRHLGHDHALPAGPRHLHHSGCAVLRARPAPGPLGSPGHRRHGAAPVARGVRAEEGARLRSNSIRGLPMIRTLALLVFALIAMIAGAGSALAAGDEVTLALDWIVNGTHAGYF